ncbi:MAG: 16S rRNA (adenine(1518)-N(6)/adenine(1519)-N(6))-dimethyltransferase RsmA [Bacteroidota bacterium]
MIRPKKHLGQHFLRDENIARKIVDYLNHEHPLVLEVGPGMGVLTKYILEKSEFDSYFMEVDRESVDYLNAKYTEIAGRLIQADFLSYDLEKFPPSRSFTSTKKIDIPCPLPKFTVIGNFPYNISSQILFKALENRDRVPEVIGMFQKEVAERIAAPPGNKTYGIISVLLQAFYDIEYLFTVNESVFSPPPKVKSAVIRLKRNNTAKLECDEAFFIHLVKTAFNQRRKTLRNAIRPLLPASAATRLSEPSTLSGYLELRAERLSVNDFVKLALELSNIS